MRIRYQKFLCLGLLLLGTQAHAADFWDPRITAGVAGGQMSMSGGADFDGLSTGWNFFVGFEFNRYLAVETGYLNGGTTTDDYFVTATVFNSDEVDNKSVHASALGSWPISDAVSVFGRAGMLSWESTTRREVNGVTTSLQDNDGVDPFYGLGIGLNVDSGQLRLEYDMTSIDDFDTAYISLGVVFRFGF